MLKRNADQWRVPRLPAGFRAQSDGPFFLWLGGDSDFEFAQDTSISGQVARQWKLGTASQKAGLEEIKNMELRLPPAHNQSVERPDPGPVIQYVAAK